ncbi:MAG: FAD-dependent oxidoreductase [Bacilli bacterium]|nr:FAD-dependent oxidoreductase [Bacilli bacterium]
MSEINKKYVSKYYGEKNPDKEILKLAKKITDIVPHHLLGLKSTDPEYWGLRETITHEMAVVLNKMKLRKFYTLDELLKLNPDYEAKALNDLYEQMAVIGIIEFDYGDRYSHDAPLDDLPKIKRYRISFFVPGSAELFNSTTERIDKNPVVAPFFERMTFMPLAGITQMIPPGGDGIGMHVIPVEKAIPMEQKSVDLEHISYWMRKYKGHIAAGLCSCRYSRQKMDEGCIDDPHDWCIQMGDMADYAVETGRAHYITPKKALDILQKAEDNGFVHQITNIDGSEHIFDICNCDVKICNALRTSMLFNTPNLSKSAYTAKVTPENCVACGLCVESCPAGAVKLGQKLCHKDGKPAEYPQAPLPDNNKWGKYAWDENYRDTMRLSDTYESGSAPCKAACPAHVPVQGYLKLAHQGKYQEALALIKKENPFPAVCGRVCNKRCEEACTRGTIDHAVNIDGVKRFVADFDLNSKTRYVPKKAIPSLMGGFKEKIAIVGAGPAGLSAAYYLALQGFKPTVFEKNGKPGGMMMYGIPSFKLEKDVLEAEIDVIKSLGVDIQCGVEVGKDVTIPQLKKKGYKAFYVAIGCQGGRRPNVPNDNAKNTAIAVDYLLHSYEHQNEKFTGDVVVIGGGNVAVDCAKTAKRLGGKNVGMYCLESAETMPASGEEVAETLAEGIAISNQWGPKEVLVDKDGKVTGIILKKCTRTIDPATKRFSPLYDEAVTKTVKCDQIVFAIGQAIEWGHLLDGSKVTFWHGNYPIADKLTYQTADPDIFVGGDVFTGPKFVIDAIAAGHFVADSLARHARPGAEATVGLSRHVFTPLDKDDISYPSYDDIGRQEAPVDKAIEEAKTFRDVRKDLTEGQVKKETGRCLGCGASVVDPHKCIGCGICTTRCQFDAIHLVRDMPENTDMRKGEDKVKGMLPYVIKRSVRILAHSGSKEAKELRKKRRDYAKTHKVDAKEKPYTGNAVDNGVKHA